jgi:Zn-dependent protease
MGLTLGRIFGTEVRAHWTWVLILAFIAVIFGTDLSDGTAAFWPTGLAWGSSIATALLVFASVAAHELAHVNVARRNGQQVPVLVVQLLGGAYVMEVKPRSAGEELRISLAGSVFSLALAVAFGVVAGVLLYWPVSIDQAPDALQAVQFVAALMAIFNVMLGLINLVPGYPMDGARILHGLVWRRTGSEDAATSASIRIGRYTGIAFMLAGALLIAVLDAAVGLAAVVAGWLMMGSSRVLERRRSLQTLVAGLHVSDAEETDAAHIPPQLTLDVFAGEYLAERLGAAALVERGSELLGLIGTSQIRRIPRRNWTLTHTAEAMIPIANVPSVSGDLDLWSALEVLERSGLDALLVAAGVPGAALVTRRSAAKVVHEKVEARQRELLAQGLVRKGRFRGR